MPPDCAHPVGGDPVLAELSNVPYPAFLDLEAIGRRVSVVDLQRNGYPPCFDSSQLSAESKQSTKPANKKVGERKVVREGLEDLDVVEVDRVASSRSVDVDLSGPSNRHVKRKILLCGQMFRRERPQRDGDIGPR